MNIPNDIIKSKKKIEDFFEPSSEFEREYQKRYDDELDTCPNYPISYCILQDVFKRVFDNYRFYGPSANKSDIEFINLENLFNEAKYIAEDISSPMRHQAYQATYDAVRDIPGVGQVMEANQYLNLFNKVTGKNKDDQE